MIKLIENAEPILKKINISESFKIKTQYLNQLMEIGFYAVNVGLYNREVNEIIKGIKKRNTKLIVTINTKENFDKAIKNSKIDFVELSSDVLKQFREVPSDSSKIILNYFINIEKDYKDYRLEKENNNLYLKKINLHKLDLSVDIIELLKNIENSVTECELGINILSINHSYNEMFNYLYNSNFQFVEVSLNGWIDTNNESFLPIQKMITYLMKKKEKMNINTLALETAYNTAKKYFQNSKSF